MKGSLGAVVKLLPCDHEVTGSSPGNNLLQKSDGELFVWGKNSSGQLGLGKSAGKVVSTPRKVDYLADVRVKMTALGSEHSIVVTEDGEALSWGAAGAGRLGHGHKSSFLGFAMTSNEYTPRLIKNLDGIKIKRIAAGMLHSACIDEKGTVFMFGQKTEKVVLGRSNDAPRPSAVEEIQFSEEVACGGYHTCAVTVSLPRGTGMVRFPEVVRSSLFKLPVSKVSCGWKHTAAISGCPSLGLITQLIFMEFPWLDNCISQNISKRSGEDIYTWGWGGANGTFFEEGHSSGGQLGHGNDVDYCEPMMVELGKNASAVHVSCGFNHTGAILEYVEN
uniref:Ultraviolet-B receptor UVR8 n=1 Tax=Aegilops tauschii TaxID=37682 RepID=M8CC81_AEGTA